MGSCCARLRELDADEVFAVRDRVCLITLELERVSHPSASSFVQYNTIKVVRVKDRYLGIMRLLSMLAIFLYIVVYVLIISKKVCIVRSRCAA